MSHDEDNPAGAGIARIVRMANQIGIFYQSKPHDEGVAGVAEHINKFWEPRMRQHFFEVFDTGGEGMLPIVVEAAPRIRRPSAPISLAQAEEADAGAPGGKGNAAGEATANIAASPELL